MRLADYFLSKPDIGWDYAKQCGVTHAVIRLPEDKDFSHTEFSHWQTVYDRFTEYGFVPSVIEPMPNALHDHIKVGDEKRDESIESVIKMFPIMERLGIQTICFNWMAHIGWLRTATDIPERGGALVTGFDMNDFQDNGKVITAEQLWENYRYFISAVLPDAEKHGIRLALHPDDPPLARLGGVERIMISYENIRKAIDMFKSPSIGVTMCQASYQMMGEDLFHVIPQFGEKIFFIHFRNATGNKYKFHETFHDNGDIDMASVMELYKSLNLDVPIRVDHTPLMAGERSDTPGYGYLGRLFAIGYLKGLLG